MYCKQCIQTNSTDSKYFIFSWYLNLHTHCQAFDPWLNIYKCDETLADRCSYTTFASRVQLTRPPVKKSRKDTISHASFVLILLSNFATLPIVILHHNLCPSLARRTVTPSMHWLTKEGLRKAYRVRGVLLHLPKFESGRYMSSSQPKKPVTLLGTMAFGGRANAEQSLDMVKAFLDRGHKQVDTAFMYMDGKSEVIIGGMNLPKTGSFTLAAAPLVGKLAFFVC